MCRKESSRFATATRPHGTRGQGPRSHTGTSTCASKWTLRQPKLCRRVGFCATTCQAPINARRRERRSVLGSEPDCPCRCESPICVRHTFMACLRMLGDRDRPSIPCINTRAFELHRFLSEAECRPRMRIAHNPLWTSGLIRIWPSPSKISCSLCGILVFSLCCSLCLIVLSRLVIPDKAIIRAVNLIFQ